MSYSEESNETRWWAKGINPTLRAERIRSATELIEVEDSTRQAEIMHYLRLYGVRDFFDMEEQVDVTALLSMLWQQQDLRYNLVKSVIDTAVSRIGKNKPKAAFLTSGATWGLQTQSKKLEKYVEGVFLETKLYKKGRMTFRDGMIGGTGAVKFFPKLTRAGWKVWCERIFPWELLVDRYDGRYGEPRAVYHTKYIDVEVAKRKWKLSDGDLHTALKRTPRADGRAVSEQLKVIEGWRLPSGPKAKDGRHVISLGSVCPLDEEWDEDWFPIPLFHWTEPPIGFFGSGAAADVNGIQIEINRLLEIIQRGYSLYGKPHVLVHRGARVIKSHITDEIGRVLEWEGSVEPKVVTHQPINPQMFQYLGMLKDDGYQIPGVSQMAAQNKKPADLESGEALRRWNDIEDSRHASPALAYEEFYMECARVTVGMSKRMHKEKKTPKTMGIYKRRSRQWTAEIDWKEVNLDEDSYIMQIFPMSSLPSTPAGRTATIQEWTRAGLVNMDEARYLMDMPDLEAYNSLRLAPLETILDAIESIIDKGKYIPPEPFQGLEMTLEYIQLAYLRARLDAVPEDRLEDLRTYMVNTEFLIKKASGQMEPTVQENQMLQEQAMQQQAQPAPAPGGAMPQQPPVDPGILAALAPQGNA